MTHYKVNAETCYSIFTKAESSVSPAQSAHSSIRSGIDQLGALCAKGEATQITSALQGAYNRVLTQNMTTAEQRITKAVAGDVERWRPSRRAMRSWPIGARPARKTWVKCESRMVLNDDRDI